MEVADGSLFPKSEEETVRLSGLELVGAGHQPTLKKRLEGQNFYPALSLAACKWLLPRDQMVKETVQTGKKGGRTKALHWHIWATSGLISLDAHQVQGRRAWRTHYTQICICSPSSTVWQLIPVFLVPYNIVAVHSDSCERIKHYALDKLHPFAKSLPHLSPNKNILNDYTEPKWCWSLPKV